MRTRRAEAAFRLLARMTSHVDFAPNQQASMRSTPNRDLSQPCLLTQMESCQMAILDIGRERTVPESLTADLKEEPGLDVKPPAFRLLRAEIGTC